MQLDQVKAELQGTRFPCAAEEGFRRCKVLSTTALRRLRALIGVEHLAASEE